MIRRHKEPPSRRRVAVYGACITGGIVTVLAASLLTTDWSSAAVAGLFLLGWLTCITMVLHSLDGHDARRVARLVIQEYRDRVPDQAKPCLIAVEHALAGHTCPTVLGLDRGGFAALALRTGRW